ncbi:MAG: hypothetical protein DI536_29960 [Archangium gephyra]|uniref:Alanine dehydrogenase/pyridine nucleotide transhydrogenase N-terminal domain-containing protein n=1 Tax=Archangium gephyra TaxID=48 RepID=A0A2W5T577_9BACT|nr:MAG: hypothetical protein DI536_29960 [Archangium gephyra]
MAIRTVGFPRPHQEPGEVRDFPPSVTEFLAQFDLDAIVLEDGYGTRQGLSPADYTHPKIKYGAVSDCYAQDLVVTLRCPRPDKFAMLRPGSTLLSMLHFPTRPDRVRLCESMQIIGVAMDQVADDLGRRVIENLEAVGFNGVKIGMHRLATTWADFASPSRRPLQVTVLGAGAVGAHAVRAAVRYGDDAVRAELRAKQVPGVEVTSVDVELTTSPDYLLKRLAVTDLLVDATQRRDTTQVIVRNEWLAHLPEHAVIVDLSVDPYDFTRDPPGVKGVEGIPQGSLDQYVFAREDPAWDAIDPRVPHAVRRSVVSCYSWPGIDPAACMRVYGKQIEPVLRALIEKGPDKLRAVGGPWMERATARAMHRHFLPQTETTS